MVFDKKQYQKEWCEKNKEKIKQQKREWSENNKEHKKQYQKEYYKKNKENIKQQNDEWRQTPYGKKSNTISKWKRCGLKLFGYTYDEVYEYYLDCDNCEICNKDISMSGHQKNMDHCHDTGIFRWILCQSCNTNDNWMNKI